MELANVVIKFGAEGAKEITDAVKAIQANTATTVTALNKMQTTLGKMNTRGLAGVSTALKNTQTAAEKVVSSFALYRKELSAASSKSEQYIKAIQKIGNQYGYTNKALQRWLPDIKKAEEYIRKKSAAMSVAGRAGDVYYEKMSRIAVMERMLNGTLGSSSKAFKQLKPTIESTTTAMEKNSKAVSTGAKGIRNLIPHVAAVTLSYMAMRRAVNALTAAFKAGVDYERQMAHVGAIARATAEEFDLLSDAARRAGETTVWTATEAATALRYLSMAGFSAAESVESLAGVLNLALIGEMDLGRATDIATDTLRAFGLEASELDKVVDVMVGTITRSNTNIEKMGQALKYVAPVAAKLGYTVEEVSAMIGVLSQSGIKSGIAGRALRMSFLKSSAAARELGIESTNLIDVLKELNSRNLTPVELTDTLTDLFGIRSTPALLTLMQGMEQLEQFTETLRNAEGETQAYVDRLDTVTVAWEKLKSVMTDVAIEIFAEYTDELKETLKDGTEWIKEHKEEIKDMFDFIIKWGPDAAKSIIGLYAVGKLTPLFSALWKAVIPVFASMKSGIGVVATLEAGVLALSTAMKANIAILTLWASYKFFTHLVDESDKMEKLGDKMEKATVDSLNLAAQFKAIQDTSFLSKEQIVNIDKFVEGLNKAEKTAKVAKKELKETFGELDGIGIGPVIALDNALKKADEQLEILAEKMMKASENAARFGILTQNFGMANFWKEHNAGIKEMLAAQEEALRDENWWWRPPSELSPTAMKAFNTVLDALENEINMVGKSAKEQEIAQAIRRAGVDIMSTEAQTITAFINKLYELRDAQKAVVEQAPWYESLTAGEQADPYIKRLSYMDAFTAKTKQSLAEQFKDNAENAEEILKYRVDAEMKLYDARVALRQKGIDADKKFREDMLKLDREYSMKTGDLLNEFVDGPYKTYILEQANLAFAAEAEKLNFVKAGSKEALEIIKHGQQLALEIIKDGLSKQKKEYKDLYDFRRKYENELEAQYEEENIDPKVYQGTLDQKSADTIKQENDKLQAMKSMYTSMSKYSVQFYQSLERAVDIEFNNYMQKLGLKGIAIKDFTKDQEILYKDLLKWKSLKLEDPFKDVLKGMSDSFDGEVFGDSMANGFHNALVAFDELIETFEDQIPEWEKLASLQQSIVDKQKELTDYVAETTDETRDWNKVSKLQEEIAKGNKNILEGQLEGYAAMAGAASQFFGQLKQMFAEGSKEYEAFAMAEKIAGIANILLKAATAIINAGASGDGYTAIARMAAVAAAVGSVLSQIGLSISGPSGGDGGLEPADYTSGSTLLGAEEGTVSESLENAFELLEDVNAEQYDKLVDIYYELRELNSNITGLVTSIIKTGDLGGLTMPNATEADYGFLNIPEMAAEYLPGVIGIFVDSALGFLGILSEKIVGFLFGGDVSYNLLESGLEQFTDSLTGTFPIIGDILKNLDTIQMRSYILYEKITDGGLFSEDDHDILGDRSEELDDISRLFTNVIINIGETMLKLSDILGYGKLTVKQIMDYAVNLGHINLKNLNAEQIGEALNAFFSNFADQMAEDLFGPLLKRYQKIDEGLYETAIRLAMEKEMLISILDMTGVAFRGTAYQAVILSQVLIGLSGDIETLMEDAEAYFDNFLSDAEKHTYLYKNMAGMFANLNVTLPETREEFKDLIESLDLTTDEGQKTYITLIALSESMGAFYDATEAANKVLLDLNESLAETNLESTIKGVIDDWEEGMEAFAVLNSGFTANTIPDLQKQLSNEEARAAAILDDSDLTNDYKWFAAKEKIAQLNSDIAAMEEIAVKYIALESIQLDAMKIALGLVTNAEYTAKRMLEIDKHYSGMGSQNIIDMFAGMNIDEIKSWAKELGIVWTDIAKDVAFLIERETELNNIRRKQDEFKGQDPDIWDLAKRWNIDYEDANQEFAKDMINKFLSMSAEEVVVWAASLNMTVDQLLSDMDVFNDMLETIEETMTDFVERLRAIADNLLDSIVPKISQDLLSEITIIRKIDPANMTEENISDLERLIPAWYSLAVQEAEAKAALLEQEKQMWEQVVTTVKSLMESIDSTIQSIKYSALNRRPYQKTVDAQSDYDTLFKAAMSGNQDDIQAFISFSQTYLQTMMDQFGSSQKYLDAYNQVLLNLEEVRERVDSTDFSQKLYEEQVAANIQIDTDLTSINETAMGMIDWLKTIANTLESKLPIGVGYADGGIATGPSSGYLALLHGTEVITPMSQLTPMQSTSENDNSTQRPMNITIQIGNQKFDAYVDARADNVRVTANKSKGSATKRLYHAPAN